MHPENGEGEWSSGERSLLDELPLETQPPAELEERIVRELKGRGYFSAPASSASPRLSTWWLVAAALTLLVIGFLGGRFGRAETARRHGSEFVLFLYDNESLARQPDDHVAEYRAWAGNLRRRGLALSGEKLNDDGVRMTPGPGGAVTVAALEASSRVGGYFLLDGSDLATARQVALSCPHLRHGGTIELRQIDDVTR